MHRRVLFLIQIFGISALLFSQTIDEMEFNNQPIRDILLVLAQMSGQSIIADNTVAGNASYYFNHIDLDQALEQFLSHYGMFYWKKNNIFYGKTKLKI